MTAVALAYAVHALAVALILAALIGLVQWVRWIRRVSDQYPVPTEPEHSHVRIVREDVR